MEAVPLKRYGRLERQYSNSRLDRLSHSTWRPASVVCVWDVLRLGHERARQFRQTVTADAHVLERLIDHLGASATILPWR